MSNMLDLESLMDDDRKRHLKGIPPLDGGYTAMAPASLWMLRGQVQAALGCGIAFRPIIPSAFAIGACLRYFRGLGRIAASDPARGRGLQLFGYLPDHPDLDVSTECRASRALMRVRSRPG